MDIKVTSQKTKDEGIPSQFIEPIKGGPSLHFCACVPWGNSDVSMPQTHSGHDASRDSREDRNKKKPHLLSFQGTQQPLVIQPFIHSLYTLFLLLLFLIILYLSVFFLAALGLHCCPIFSLVVESRGYSLVMVHGPLIAVASLVAGHRL